MEFNKASPCPDIKSVSWPRSSEEQTDKRRRDQPALIPRKKIVETRSLN